MSHNWKNILVSPDTNIQEVLQVLNKEAMQLVLVVDDNHKLLGTVTDGDIRRALINSIALSAPVSDIMFTTPTTATVSTTKASLLALMQNNGINSIPILTDDKVVGVETLQHVMKKTQHQNPILIMAGGYGTRLRPLTDNCPKPMLYIGDKPILETVIISFINSGFVNFYISTHFMPEKIQSHFGDGSQWGVNIHYVHEDSPLGTGGALGLLPQDMPDLPIIMMNGDVLTKVNFERLLEFHIDNAAHATMCVRKYDYQIPYGVINNEGNKIISMVEKPTQRFFVNAGIYVVSQALACSVPVDHIIDMPTLLEQYIAKQKDVLMFPIHEYWLDIGRMDDFNRAQADIHNLGMNE
ncbi:CBS domain-containing protein [Shewanella sp. SG44-2]|uniref:nucleotidyltransferase family protein n=1 Tax=Shewanella sp. SG44-2 TaxID=2760962 RepID=UPI001601E221|nr:nucleotidyltransferase family protein [Shewanella sp. SG44-2]MBB1428509.1 CBS domain-containing protein [Shewanella sp. SG44-2]